MHSEAFRSGVRGDQWSRPFSPDVKEDVAVLRDRIAVESASLAHTRVVKAHPPRLRRLLLFLVAFVIHAHSRNEMAGSCACTACFHSCPCSASEQVDHPE